MKFPLFSRKKATNKISPKEISPEEITAQIAEINNRILRLEQSIEHQNAKLPQISIQNVHIHQPVLKSLEFRLDGLDIETLSGSLNLGNNIGVKTGLDHIARDLRNKKSEQSAPPVSDAKASNEVSSDQIKSSPEAGLHRTPYGFQVRRD